MNFLTLNNSQNNRRPQDWLGIGIMLSCAIFAALFVLAQVAQFIDESAKQQIANEVQSESLRSAIHQGLLQ